MAVQAGETIIAGKVPGERIATTEVTSDSSTFTTEIVIASVTAALVTGRTYKITLDTALDCDEADNTIRVRIREDNLTGNQIQLRDVGIDARDSAWQCHLEVEFTAASTASKTFVATAAVETGTGTGQVNASAGFPTYLYVEYVRGP